MKKSTIEVEVVYALPDNQMLIKIDVPIGSTALQAAQLSGIMKYFPDLDITTAKMGIFSKSIAKPNERILVEGDRVEIYRQLIIDPKEARRRRVASVGSSRASS